MRARELVIKSLVYFAIAVLWWLIFSPAPRQTKRREGAVYHNGVTVVWVGNDVVVRLDGQEEKLSRDHLGNSALYQEAIARLPPGDRPSDMEFRLAKKRMRRWLVFTAITWWLLFRFWRPPNRYLEGGPV